MIYFLVVAGVILLDYLLKHAVTDGMGVGKTIPVVQDVFHVTYVQNRGAAFSLMEGQWVFLIALPAAAILIALILLFVKRNKWNRILKLAVALICGGGIGNLIDRIGTGYVVDYLDFRVFPVFNAADIFICIGCALLLLDVILEGRKERKLDERSI